MSNWQEYFDAVVVINLKKREDRLLRITEMLSEYNIEASVFEAIESNVGYVGLIRSIKTLFKDCLSRGYERVIVLEDDCKFVVSRETFDNTMNKCVDELKKYTWGLFYLGVQACLPFKGWRGDCLVEVNWGQSTHAVAYSKHAMQFAVDKYIDEPIDNFWVHKYQPHNLCLASYPLLATQEVGYSDICKEHTDWTKYITPLYEKAILGLKK